MKTAILICALLLGAPAFAQDYDDEAPPPPPDDSAQQYPPDDSAPQYAPADEAGPSLEDFRNDSELSWNGEWIDTPDYGTVWRPTHVSDEWQPYLYGRWAWTNAGWAWVSEEPFGWAVYHYGRWADSPSGWLWIPGQTWSPAWVAWHWGDGYAGWSPLGPRRVVYQQPQQWVYVKAPHFLEPVRQHYIPRRDRPVTSIGGQAPAPRMVERTTGRTVRPLAISDAPTPHAATASSNNVFFYRPRSVQTPRSRTYAGPPQQGVQRQADPRAQRQVDPRAQPQHPVYFGGVPGPRQGGTPRPQAAPPRPQGANAPAPASKPKAESKPEQPKPHARERD
jgi:uncharacterized protein DUF6600